MAPWYRSAYCCNRSMDHPVLASHVRLLEATLTFLGRGTAQYLVPNRLTHADAGERSNVARFARYLYGSLAA